MQTLGRTRASVRFSSEMRSGPGRSSSVWLCMCSRSKTSDNVCRSRRRLALHVDELRRMGDRLEDDDEFGRKLDRQHTLLAGRKLDMVDDELVDQRVVALFRQIDARTPNTSAGSIQ